MNRKLLGASAAALAGAFACTLAIARPTTADAAYRRVSAVTSCHADENIDVLYQNNYSQTFVATAEARTGGVFNAKKANLGVRCNVPTDSYLPHQNIQDVHISGRVGANTDGSYAKVCSIAFYSGSYHCGAQTYLPPSGSFNLALSVPSTWDDWSRFPVVTAVLDSGDKLHGIYYAD